MSSIYIVKPVLGNRWRVQKLSFTLLQPTTTVGIVPANQNRTILLTYVCMLTNKGKPTKRLKNYLKLKTLARKRTILPLKE